LTEDSGKIIPLTGVSAAFVFAAQMINFTIPGTGSSGHLAGALFLTILLGPYLSFLAMGAILLIQALFFADGGILAYGANVMNMAFFTNFIAYPLIYSRITRNNQSRKSIFTASLLTAIVGLQLGAFAVVLETALSGRVALPFVTFLTLMQSIHLAIGVVEGLVTAVLITYLAQNAPEILQNRPVQDGTSSRGNGLIALIGGAALLCGGLFSLFASDHPDGLEWSIEKASLNLMPGVSERIHLFFGGIQEKLAFLPDYSLGAGEEGFLQTLGTVLSGFSGILITAGFLSLLLITIRTVSRKRAAAK
ncbi:MAG: energy-coupling factor ABC transporter permease, partial [Spirochaetales bacterium]|nr:energy-coupling factor ABC transporter permease [Spirochaetales bacterium]